MTTLHAYKGRIVTMDAADTVLANGIVYIKDNCIAAVAKAGEAAPAGFAGVPVTDTGGTLYPGLIELHNHLSYDALKLWRVPQHYTNRDEWARHPDYRKLVSGPMNVLGKTPGYPEAIVRYVECKCLFGGVTTSQGIALFSNTGIARYYRGLVRNVESAYGLDMPAADAKIADVIAQDAAQFLAHLKKSSCLLLHLSEGTDQRAHNHFDALKMANGEVAITDALTGIHCVALKPTDFQLLKQHGGSMVWSPLSNLLLYGQTADVKAAKQAGVLMGIGSDWSPSGSKNLLGELKVAHLYSKSANGIFSDREIVAMATRNAAKILKWDKAIGSIEATKRADMIILRGQDGDPYHHLIKAKENDIELVIINGILRYGLPAHMHAATGAIESWKIAGQPRQLNICGDDIDPIVNGLTLREATDRLSSGLKNLPQLAADLEKPKPAIHAMGAAAPRWFLQLEHEEPVGVSLRPRFAAEPDAPEKIGVMLAAAVKPLSQVLKPIDLDPLTVSDDPDYLVRIKQQTNLPPSIKEGLHILY